MSTDVAAYDLEPKTSNRSSMIYDLIEHHWFLKDRKLHIQTPKTETRHQPSRPDQSGQLGPPAPAPCAVF